MPESMRAGRRGTMWCMASLMQSTGVPVTECTFAPSYSGCSAMRSGVLTVMADDCPERGSAGATAHTSPKGLAHCMSL